MAIPSLDALTRNNYGGDDTGLICGYRFSGTEPPQEVDTAAALQWLAEGEGSQGFVWLHFNLAHAAATRWLERHANLPPEFHEALQGGVHSTRIERTDDALVAVVNDVNFDFDFEPSDIATLYVAVTGRLVVSARRKALRSIDRLRADVRRGLPLRSSVE
ncbi:MAG: magnesium transporter CorA, partial [Rubrivivax sp.]